MSKLTYSSSWTHNTTPGFQAWGSQLSAAMQACGLHQTADTGQINWATAAPILTINSVSGYEIYNFTDTLQATSPIFIKIEYGTGAVSISTNTPGMWLTVGTGSDGAGNITGICIPRQKVTNDYAYVGIVDTATSFPTYVCYNGSYLGVALKVGGVTNSFAAAKDSIVFIIGRASDGTGAYVRGKIATVASVGSFSGGAASDYYGQITYRHPFVSCADTVAGTLITDTLGYYSCAWMAAKSTAVDQNNFQTYPCFGAFPQVQPLFWLLRCLNYEIADGSTVTATPFGSTPHTYINLGKATTGWGIPQLGGTSNLVGFYGTMMLWE